MNKDNVKLAIAPIGWTNDDMPELGSENTFQQIVSEMALAGFTGSEVGSKYPRDPAVLKPMLDIRGIQICNAWFSTFFANGQREKTIDEFVNHMNFLHAMGAKVIGCSEQSGSIQGLDKPILGDAKPCFSDEEWQRVAEGYNTLGRLAAEKGMQVCLHHHMGTGIQTTAEIDKFMSLVDERVFLLFDTGHAYVGDGDVMGLLEATIDRVKHVHFKDVRPDKMKESREAERSFLDSFLAGMFTVPGDGMIDFTEPYRFLVDHGYKDWILVEAEQDPAIANPLEYARKARAYLEGTLFKA